MKNLFLFNIYVLSFALFNRASKSFFHLFIFPADPATLRFANPLMVFSGVLPVLNRCSLMQRLQLNSLCNAVFVLTSVWLAGFLNYQLSNLKYLIL